MNDSAYLIFDKKGIVRLSHGGRRRGTYMSMSRPRLNAGEFAVLVTIEVPGSVFEPRTTPEATIKVPESAVVASPHVELIVEQPPEVQP